MSSVDAGSPLWCAWRVLHEFSGGGGDPWPAGITAEQREVWRRMGREEIRRGLDNLAAMDRGEAAFRAITLSKRIGAACGLDGVARDSQALATGDDSGKVYQIGPRGLDKQGFDR